MVMLKYPGFENYAMDGYLYENFRDIRDIVEKKNQSFTLVNDGKTGLGKTTLSFQEALFFARGNPKRFNLKHVLFDPEESFRIVSNAKKGDVFIFDEAVFYNSRSAMSTYNKTMLLLLSTIRSKQIYIILNIPSFFDLDRAITMDKAHMLVHLYGENFGDKGKYMVFDDEKMKKLFIFGKKTYNYNVAKSNFFASFGKEFLLDEKEYDNKKQKFVKKMMSGDKFSGTNRIRIQRDFMISYINQHFGVSYTSLQELMPSEIKLTPSTMSDGLTRIRNKYNPEWFKRRKIEDE